MRIKLTKAELEELHTSAVSMCLRLARDKHVNPETMSFWVNLNDKLAQAAYKGLEYEGE